MTSISFVLLLFVVSLSTLQVESVPSIFYPFGTQYGDSILRGDDVSSSAVRLSVAFRYFSDTYRTVYVSINVVFA